MNLNFEAAVAAIPTWLEAIRELRERLPEGRDIIVSDYTSDYEWTTGDAIIAGGAVRDLLLDRPVKDIDVFHRERMKVFDDLVSRLPVPGNPDTYHISQTGLHEVFAQPEQDREFIWTGFEDPRVYLLREFPCDISKVWFETNKRDLNGGRIVVTPEFINALQSECIT